MLTNIKRGSTLSNIGLWLLCLMLFTINIPLSAQIGPLIWEDNFDTLDPNVWVPDIGDGCNIGLCGWGNQELQSYQANNVYIEQVPGEPGNNALVLEARREQAGTRGFTSGKVTTQENLAIHYGLVEVRARVPDLDMGLWPAVWLLGTANLTWPAKGEIDMMEMGFSQSSRDAQQATNSSVNTYVGANAFFSVPGGGVGNIASDVDYNQPYVAATPLNDRFITYRIYWEPTQLRFTVIDGTTEYDLYTNPLPLDPEGVTAPFTKPFYMLLNMAVGGTLPGILNDAGINAPLPAKMYVDYVRVYEWNGHGSVSLDYGDLVAENGDFGVYTDNTPVSARLNFGTDAEIYAWGGTLDAGSIPPYEGTNVLSWRTVNPNSWFGGGIVALNGKNMSNYRDNGRLEFRIKIPADVSFRIGMTDNFTNEKFIEFPAGQNQYGLTRNGEWGQVSIPLVDFSGLLAFQDIGYMFAITSVDGAFPTSTFEFAVDDIVWKDGSTTTDPRVVTSITLSPTNITLSNGQTQQFQANAFDQFGDPIAADISWTTTGGSISASGLYTATTPGTFSVTATSGSVNANTNITVNPTVVGTMIPARIEAEDYDEGGAGVGYFDTTVGNTGGSYRTDDVDIEATGDASGAFNVGWITAGEWLQYTIDAPSSNTFDIGFRVSSPNGAGRFHLAIDGINVTGTLSVPNTGSWQNYADVTVNDIAINAGQHTLRLVFESDGLNINYFDINTATQEANNCDQVAANGDYTAQVTEEPAGTAITFIPSQAGIGTPNCILYYSTDPGITFPGYTVTANTPFILNANNGETVYFYYTYSVPGGGERTTMSSIHSFVVGACRASSTTSRVQKDIDNRTTVNTTSARIYPNPMGNQLTIEWPAKQAFHTMRVLTLQGELINTIDIEEKSMLKINTTGFTPGMYVVELLGRNATEVLRIVK